MVYLGFRGLGLGFRGLGVFGLRFGLSSLRFGAWQKRSHMTAVVKNHEPSSSTCPGNWTVNLNCWACSSLDTKRKAADSHDAGRFPP